MRATAVATTTTATATVWRGERRRRGDGGRRGERRHCGDDGRRRGEQRRWQASDDTAEGQAQGGSTTLEFGEGPAGMMEEWTNSGPPSGALRLTASTLPVDDMCMGYY